MDAGITYDELRGADMLANARKRLENEMRPRGIEPDGEQAVKDAETVRQAGLNAITPSFFELFEDYITEEDSQLAADGVELEARTAWMHENVPDHAEHTERVGDFQTGNPSPGHPPRSVCRAENNNETLKNQPI